MLKQFIGDRKFYRNVLVLMIPILIQNGLTNFVNMLDNLMVGQVGQVEMIGVSVANQLMFVYNLCIFGAVSGAGIFGAQFFGNGDHKGLRDTFRFKLVFTTLLTTLVIGVFLLFGDSLISLYLKGEGEMADAAASLAFGKEYLFIMLIGLIPAALVQCFSSTLRETGSTVPPMVAGIIAIFVNLVLNYILIFGHFGAPKMGVAGAAVATVISRFAELLIVGIWTIVNKQKNIFVQGAFKSLRIPTLLIKRIMSKGGLLMINETMWAAGLSVVNQCYSTKSMDVVAANNIVSTFFNVFGVAFMAVGASIGIIVGQLLGAGKTAEAKDSSKKLIAFSIFISFIVAVAFALCSNAIPELYNATDSVKSLASQMIIVCALVIPLDAFANAAYFTLRSGGEAFITIIFDSGFVWAISVPAAFLLCHFSPLSILPIYAICQGLNLLKCLIGGYFVKKGNWIKNIVT